MAFNSSGTTNVTGNGWNVTLPPDWTTHSTLNKSTIADMAAATHSTMGDPSSSSSASAVSFNAHANSTDLTASQMNSNNSLVTSDPGALVLSDSLPSPSATSQLIQPHVMGHARLDASMWREPGVLIGLGCSILGLISVLIGIFIYLRKKRKSSQAVRRVHVMSGFDFNDGGEDDYQHNPWHQAHLGSRSDEKSGFAMDGPITGLNSYRHSNATLYSTGDDDRESCRTNHRIETGVAQ